MPTGNILDLKPCTVLCGWGHSAEVELSTHSTLIYSIKASFLLCAADSSKYDFHLEFQASSDYEKMSVAILSKFPIAEFCEPLNQLSCFLMLL